MASYCARCNKSETVIRPMSGMKNGKPVTYYEERCKYCNTLLRSWTEDRPLSGGKP